METWLRNTFTVVPDGWENHEGQREDAFMFISSGREVTAPIAWVADAFAEAGQPPTLANLKGCDPTDSLGWHRHFDAWVEQGIVAL